MKAFLILEDGTVFEGTSIGAKKEIISEIVFNTSMTGYLEVLTDPSYAGQAVTMTYPLIGNYGICYQDMESKKGWPDGFIVRELSRMPSNFRSEDTVQHFLEENDIPGICGIDTRALTKILREKGTMNGMITTNEDYNLDEILPKLKEYTVTGVVKKVSCDKKEEYVPGDIGSKEGKADKEDNVLINAPHPEYEVVANNWEHSYTREKAVYPIESVRENKFWINVARVDNTLGDRKLLPTCYGCFE